MRRILLSLQVGAVTVALCAMSSIVVPPGSLSASVKKVIWVARTCDESNVIEAIAGGVPFLNPGPWIAGEHCQDHLEEQCIKCVDADAGAADEEGADTKGEGTYVFNLKVSSSCGQLISGRCRSVEGVWTCVATGDEPDGQCKDASRYKRQAVEDP